MSISDVLAQARGYSFGMTLAHQHLGQLPPAIRASVLANARSRVVFQTSSDDAKMLARELAVEPEDLQNLGRFEAVVKLNVNDQQVGAASINTLKPIPPMLLAPGVSVAGAVRAASQRQFGRSLAAVEAEFLERHKSLREPKRAAGCSGVRKTQHECICGRIRGRRCRMRAKRRNPRSGGAAGGVSLISTVLPSPPRTAR